MLILGIDTATPWGTVALYECASIQENSGANGEVLFEISFKAGKGGGEYLLSTLDNFIKKAGRGFQEIDLIAAGTGPGSYTGIRVGLAAVKGLATGLQKPVFGINTLRIIAENARYSSAQYIGVAIDARRGQVYGALFQKTVNGLKEIWEPGVMAIKDYAAGLERYTPAIVCGDGGKAYPDIRELQPGITGPRDWDRPSAGKLAQIAAQIWEPDAQPDLNALKACYLQRVEAEIRLEGKLDAINRQPHEN
jgi:tRNA threonylcarbamoyladenosine biosynthesis protein TsaB